MPRQVPLSYATPPMPSEDIRRIATRQRTMMYCLLAYVIFAIGSVVAPRQVAPFVVIAAFAMSIAASVFVFMLAIQLFGKGTGIVLGIGALILYLGLIPMLVVNQRATKVLKENGIPVGFMGANLSMLPQG
jgi:hypothetical protein